ncbi:MAG: hypothetical protein KKF50_03630 [Nanoarchaeota archaeon]|nr:hypothetical protein [Nanoarchaeota archaeon]
MMSAKEIFEFLKPNKWNVIVTIFLVVVIYVVWNYILPGTNYLNALRVPEELGASGSRLIGKLIASVMAGFIVITYTLISLVVYFIKEDYKDDKSKKEDNKDEK